MTWMNKWSGGFPLYLDHARGNRITDVDGHTYVDFALGDTGAMAGHSPARHGRGRRPADGRPRRHHDDAADGRRRVGGRRADPPVRDAAVVASRSRPPTPTGGPCAWPGWPPADPRSWSSPTATTARSTRPSRSPAPTARRESRPGNVAPPVPLDLTTRAATWNDLASVERELAHGDVAAILTEPALTNIGIVLPEPGFMEGLRELATRYGALLMIDETHTFSAGWGGATQRVGARAGHLRHRQVDRRRHPVRRLRHHRRRSPRRSPATRTPVTPTSSTSAGSAARSPATRCRPRRCGRPWARCSPRRPSRA